MKIIKTLGAALVALASVGIASAQVNIKITGSTAFRKAAYFSIVDSLNNVKIATTAASGGDMTGAAQAVIVGTGKSSSSYSGQTVTVQTAFAGSVGGINATANSLSTIPGSGFANNATWLSASNITSSTPLATVNTGTGTITGFTTVAASSSTCDAAAIPNATFSDSFQSSSPFPTPALNDENPAGLGVGVVQFFWVKENDTGNSVAASLTNISSMQANLLLSAGILPLSVFTGNPADGATDVVLVGRNNDSGTRLDTEAESFSGSGSFGFGNSIESQYQPIITSGKVSGTNSVGDAGYSSGGNVAAALAGIQSAGATDSNGSPFIFVGYVGKSDTKTAVAGGATVLSYNGVTYPYTSSDAVVQNGAYSFWSYEHIYYKSGLSTGQVALAKDIGNQLRTVDVAQSGISIASMNVSRSIEGGTVSP